jgi:hypothetical protein
MARSHPALFSVMGSLLRSLPRALLTLALACSASVPAAPPGILEGHLKIYSPREVDLADGHSPAKMTEDYSAYPLLVLSRDREKQVARIVADGDGNYRVALPPGDYVLDAEGRARGHLRTKPLPFSVVSRQTVRIDMDIDTGVR